MYYQGQSVQINDADSSSLIYEELQKIVNNPKKRGVLNPYARATMMAYELML